MDEVASLDFESLQDPAGLRSYQTMDDSCHWTSLLKVDHHTIHATAVYNLVQEETLCPHIHFQDSKNKSKKWSERKVFTTNPKHLALTLLAADFFCLR